MIRCPKCNAVNQRGNRYCGECGASLPMRTALRCPMCGAMNSVGNVYCDKCNARLVPMTDSSQEQQERKAQPSPIKGLSLPTIPLDEREKEQTPNDHLEVGTEEETADWLTQLRASTGEEGDEPLPSETSMPESAPRSEPAEPADEETGDWLAQLRASTVEEEIVEEIAVPEMPMPQAESLPVKPTQTTEPEEEADDWLTQLRASTIEDVEEKAPAPPTPALTEAPEEPAPAAPEPADVPDWLQDAAAPAAPEEPAPAPPTPALTEAPEEPAPAAPEPADMPDWLQDAAAPAAPEEPAPAAPTPALTEAPEEPAPAAPTPVLTDVPDWLQEAAVAGTAVSEESTSSTAEQPSAVPRPVPADVPDWLQETAPPSAEELPLEPEIAEGSGLARADIPDWLEAARPTKEADQVETAEEPLETGGLLDGLRGVLPLTSAIEMPSIREKEKMATKTSEASLARAQLLQSLLSRSAETTQPKPTELAGVTMGVRLQRLVIGIALIISILVVPIIKQSLNAPLAHPGWSSRETAQTLYNTIENVNNESIVLVAFEYGPMEADELDLVARPLLQHLNDREVSISVGSTQPMGLAAAKSVLKSTGVTVEQEIGYRPGDATGVSRLLEEADPFPDLVLVLTAEPAPLRWWIEQTHAWEEATPPIMAGVSAALEAASSPYLDPSAGQLEGALCGLSGAAAYEEIHGMKGPAARRLESLAAAHVTAVGLILIGALFYTFARPREEE